MESFVERKMEESRDCEIDEWADEEAAQYLAKILV